MINNDLGTLKKNVDYFMVNKETWEFLFNIYGGGPTIKKNVDEGNNNSRGNDETQ